MIWKWIVTREYKSLFPLHFKDRSLKFKYKLLESLLEEEGEGLLGKDDQDTKRVSNRLFNGEALTGGFLDLTKQVEEVRARTVLGVVFIRSMVRLDGPGFG